MNSEEELLPAAHEDVDDLSDSSDSDDDSKESLLLWNASRCQDLFSRKTFTTAAECLDHCKNIHGFDVKFLRKRHAMNHFSYIRFINYLRQEQPSPGLVMNLSSDALWRDEKYMKPTVPDDALLMFDIEDDFSDDDEEEEEKYKKAADDDKSTELYIVDEIRDKLDVLRRQIELKNKQAAILLADVERMREVAKNIIVETPTNAVKNVAAIGVKEDNGYAGSYAHFSIHHQMLSDTVRTESYRQAVVKNAGLLRGKTVLDVGCGTGILSLFCANEAAAGRVVGVEMSDVAHQAMDIVIENRLQDRITVIKGKLEDIDLKKDKFDVLISEWMGYFLLYEGMLDSVMNARDKHLVDGGLILPNRCTMHLVAISDPQRYGETVEYFDDVYGYRMSCMKAPMIKEASIEQVDPDKVATSVANIHQLDMHKCTSENTEFETEFEIVANKDAQITAVAGYFRAFFDLEHAVTFSTGPEAPPTHWKQTLFYLKEKLPVRCGQKIVGKIKVTRPRRDIRSLDVKLSLDGRKPQKFCLE